MQDISIGKANKENNQMAELMRYSKQGVNSTDEIAQEAPQDAQAEQT